MRPILRLMAAAFVLAGLTAERASADMLYQAAVNGTFRKGNAPAGTFNGTFNFSTSGAALTLTGANITTSGPITVGNSDFIEMTYTLANTPTHTLSTSELYLWMSNDYWLKLVFDPELFSGSTPLVQANVSGEHQNGPDNASGDRKVDAGGTVTVTAVPEPSAVAIVALCAPAVWVYGRRRRKTASAA